MPASEFELIRRYFSQNGPTRPDVVLGIGDDCALLRVPPGQELAVSIDTLVEGIHFLPGTDPEALGHKALAVNLSDLAAMGAEPAWVTLALTLPAVDPAWLAAFSRGFAGLAAEHGVQLVGGDTTRGPLAISVQAHGFAKPDCALRRDGAGIGDLIYVTGTLGDAGLALRARRGTALSADWLPSLATRLDRPAPRVREGRKLAGLASAAIDISDGLISDLGHICNAGGVGAALELERLPCSYAVREWVEEEGDWGLPLAAGDDYELCVTVPPERREKVEQVANTFECGLTRVGTIEAEPGVRCLDRQGRKVEIPAGYEHFVTHG